MPKLSLEFAVDFGSLTKELEKAEAKSKDAFANIGDGAAVGAITSAFRDIAEQIEAMSGASEKFNKTWDAGLKTDEKRLSIAKEMLKTQQQMADLEKHTRQAEEATGKSGGGGGGTAGGGGLGGRRGGYMNRALGRGQSMIGAGFGLLNQASGGLTTASDYLSLGGSVTGMAGKGMMGAAGLGSVLGMGSKLLGPVGLGLYAASEGLQHVAKLSKVSEQHDARAYSAYQSGGEGAYNAYQQAQAFEYGRGARSTPGGSYGFHEYGISPDQASGFLGGMSKASAGSESPGTIRDLSALYRQYGASTEAMGLMGVTQRAGGFSGGGKGIKQAELFAKAMGVALAQDLSHGRVGEAFEQIGTVASDLQKRGDVNMDVVMGLVTSIGRMGDRYQGTGIGAQQAQSTLQGLATSKTAYGYTQNYLRIQEQNPGLDAFGIKAKMATQGAADYMQVARERKGEAADLLKGTDGSETAKWNISGRLASFYGVGDANMRAFHDILWTWADDAKLVDKEAGRAAILDKVQTGISTFRRPGAAWNLEAFDPSGLFGDRTADITRAKNSTYAEQQAGVQGKAKAAQSGRDMYQRVFGGSGGAAAAPTGEAPDGGPVVTPLTGAGSVASMNAAEMRSYNRTSLGSTISSPFGRDRTRDASGDLVAGGGTRKHKGTDLAYGSGDPVFSPVTGTVLGVYFINQGGKKKLGWTVDIWSEEEKRKYRLLHLDKTVKKYCNVGKSIRKGNRVCDGLYKGLSGGAHVHAEVRTGKGANARGKGGTAVDPATVFPMESLHDPSLGIGKPEDMDPASATPGGSSAAPAGADLGSDPTGLGVSAVAAPTASGGVSVALTITDRTSAGVSVAEASRSHSAKAMQPSPGDIPTLNNREGV